MHRARRFVLLVLLATVFLVALLLTAFGGGTAARVPAAFSRTLLATAPQARPYPEIVAMRGDLHLQLPVSQARVTAIGYHSAQDGGLALSPAGHQANEGFVSRVVHGIFGGGGGTPRWYQLGGGTSVLDVGAPVGTTVYSPVDGTIVAIQPFVVEGRRYGSEIEIAPQTSPSLVVDLTQLVADPGLEIGSAVVSGATKIGKVADLALVERQALAHYTNDAGNHVTVEVRAAPVLQTG